VGFQRIVARPSSHSERAVHPGTRFPAAILVGLIAEGMTIGEILADFPSSLPMTCAKLSSSPPLLSIRPAELSNPM